MKNILIIVAHPDDAEFGMGGTILKLSKQEALFPTSSLNTKSKEYVITEV